MMGGVVECGRVGGKSVERKEKREKWYGEMILVGENKCENI